MPLGGSTTYREKTTNAGEETSLSRLAAPHSMVLKNQLGPVDGGLSARNSINTKGSTAFTVGRMMVDAAKPIGSNQPVLGNFNLEALKRH